MIVRPSRPFLLDVTRLISRSWTARQSTGIDRVCYAYLRQLRTEACAVVQYGGFVGALKCTDSDRLFDLLEGPDDGFRRKVMKFLPATVSEALRPASLSGTIYINASHTDFDLRRHSAWVEESRVRPVYFLHDLIPITHPELCHPGAVKRHRNRVIAALRRAQGIVVNSRATASELGKFADSAGFELPKVATAPLAGADLCADVTREERAQLTRSAGSTGEKSRPYYVSIGSIEPRKNYLMLLRVWARLTEKYGSDAPKLVIMGQWGENRSFVRKIQNAAASMPAHVELAVGCNDAELGRRLRNGRALLMPTLAEGFGLPMIEALHTGTPVIASDLPCFREIGQGVPLLLDSNDEDAWENAITGFDRPFSDRSRQLEMLLNFRGPSWEDHFSVVRPWLELLSTQDCPMALPRTVFEDVS